ncbi:hypothetical protein Glove_71g180 [Diversispora epigaea]|uniref:Uncharacterized protein n=1 Tax=Diversispora epigaea TaxID=1348612 RepID=A0A397J9U4_9GLOM|nr:hypothetical protein Glove_71g180 [Diversispora epigaea]
MTMMRVIQFSMIRIEHGVIDIHLFLYQEKSLCRTKANFSSSLSLTWLNKDRQTICISNNYC